MKTQRAGVQPGEKASGRLIDLVPKGAYKNDGEQLSTWADSDRTMGNCFKPRGDV